MEIEKRRSKLSFLCLFDRNGVSRKNLLHANSNLPDELKQVKENVENMPKPQSNRIKADENGVNPINMTNYDFNSDLSVGSDVRCETKVPGLVARLMGLDSLPASTVDKLSSTASRVSNSPGSSHCHEDAVDSVKSKAHEAPNSKIEARQPKDAAMRILDLKQNSEAALHAPTHEKIVDANTVEGSRDLEKIGAHHNGSNRKSTILTKQANAAVQRRGTLTSNGNMGYKQKEQNEITSYQFFRTQKPVLQRALKQRTCTSRNSHYSELGQKKQMQNSVTSKGKSTSTVDSKRPATRSSSGGARKTANKVSVIDNVRPSSFGRRATDAKKEFPMLKTKNSSIKKSDVLPDISINNYGRKSIKYNTTTDGRMNQDAVNKKACKDVVSFTFTSPLKKESQFSTPTNNVDVNAPGLHMTDGEGLSVLLDKKVQDLTSRVNSPECTPASRGSFAVLLSSDVSIESGGGEGFHSDDLRSGMKSHSMHNYGCSSSDDLMLNMNQLLQETKAIRQHSSDSNIETEYYQDGVAEQVCGLSYLEFEYVKDMLSSGELMEENFGLGETITNKVIKTKAFDALESWSSGTENDGEEHLKVERNLLFDLVSECLQFRRTRRAFIGRYKARALQGKVWWEEDFYSEIQRFDNTREVKVDELVYKDMTSPHDTWLHFQAEPFPEILLLEIEWDISTSLINDLVSDLLHH